MWPQAGFRGFGLLFQFALISAFGSITHTSVLPGPVDSGARGFEARSRQQNRMRTRWPDYSRLLDSRQHLTIKYLASH